MNSLIYLSKDDYYEVRLGSMLASYDRDLLAIMYQPIIGYAAMALYFTLWSEVKKQEYSSINKHETLLKEMDIDSEELLKSRRKLEAIGLLKTYCNQDKRKPEISYYTYELYAPKSPEDFFNDVIYKGMLTEKIGVKEVERISIILSSKGVDLEGKSDVSANFGEIFTVNDDAALKSLNITTSRGRKTIDIISDFDIGEFLLQINAESAISKEAFTNEDLNEISRLATLFGFSSLYMVEIVTLIYDPSSKKHLDYKEMYNTCVKMSKGNNIVSKDETIRQYEESDEFTKKLNEMTQYSPFAYLKLKQGFTNPAPADVNIINKLSSNYGFNNGVINAIIDYTLIRCDNSLPGAYVEKIAATIKRKNITTALGVCNALDRKVSKNKVTKDKQGDDFNNSVNESSENEIIDSEQILKDIESL